MRQIMAILALAGLALAARADGPDADKGLAAVAELGRVNGTALACNRADIVGKAKALMVQRAPKTRQYGEAFEVATNEAFLALTADQARCPVEVILSLRFEAADLRFADVFPLPPAK